MKNLKKFLVLSIALIVAFAMIACSSETDGDVSDNGQGQGNTVTIDHELDSIRIKTNPERIVVFDYGILDALDRIDAGVVGLPKATLPDYLDKYQADEYIDAGTLKEPNFEVIYEMKPDLIIISARQMELYDEFKEIAPTVYLNVDGGDYMGSFRNNMEVLGKIFEKEDELAAEVEKIDDAITALNEKASEMEGNALFLMVNEGNLSVFGPGSRYGMLYNEFGLEPADPSIESSNHGQKVSFEYIVEVNPDYLFVMDRADVTGGDSSSDVLENELIESTDAYKNDNIKYLDAHIWYISSGGITGTERMVEQVQEGLNK